MRHLVAAGLMAGCSFTQGVNPQSAPDAPGAPEGTDAAGTVAATCHEGATDPSLRLCLDFEEMPLTSVAHDVSPTHDDAALTDVTATVRDGQGAVVLSPSSSIVVPPSPQLAVEAAFTVEMWLDVQSSPGHNQRAYPLDASTSYGLMVDEHGNLGCYVGNKSITASMPDMHLAPPGWQHAACTYDGHDLQVYVDGSAVACTHADSGPGGMAMGMQVGVEYVGGLDDVHLYARALSGDELCAHAGMSACGSCRSN